MRTLVSGGGCFPLVLIFISNSLYAQLTFVDGFEGCASGCSMPLACPPSQPGEVCIAGRLYDIETAAPICSLQAGSGACTSFEQGGSCALALRVFDAFAFLGNPPGTPPIVAAETLVDGCGRFRLGGFDVPETGFAMILIDDASSAPDVHVIAADIHPVSGGTELEEKRLHAVRRTTDENWTSTAGSPFGASTFSEVGVYAAIFLHDDTPSAGVQVRSDGSPVVTQDYYFSDATSTSRSTIDPGLNATGVNGSVLFATTAVSVIGGAGGEPPGCVWPEVMSGSTAGLVVVHDIIAVIDGQPGVICP